MAGWLMSKKLVARQTIVDGFENTPKVWYEKRKTNDNYCNPAGSGLFLEGRIQIRFFDGLNQCNGVNKNVLIP